jgi:hypothetical protein
MADKKISQLTGASTPLAGTEVLPIVQSGSTVKVAVSDLTAGRTVSASGVTVSGLTASKAVFTDGSKNLSSTGTVGVDQGGTGATTFSSGYALFGNGGSAIGTGNLYLSDSNQINFGAGGSANNYTILNLLGTSNSANGSAIVGKRGGSNAWLIGDTLSALGSGTGLITFVNGANPYIIYTNSAEALNVSSAQNVTVSTGNLVIGTAAKGIDFSATTHAAGMTSELFNDYEEGTWTPAITFDSGMTGSFTYTRQDGRYTKIGRIVIASFQIEWTAIPSAGDIMLLNLPITTTRAKSVQGFISNVGGITFDGFYAITGGTNVVVTDYTTTQAAISTIKSAAAYADPLKKASLTSASGLLYGEIVYEA